MVIFCLSLIQPILEMGESNSWHQVVYWFHDTWITNSLLVIQTRKFMVGSIIYYYNSSLRSKFQDLVWQSIPIKSQLIFFLTEKASEWIFSGIALNAISIVVKNKEKNTSASWTISYYKEGPCSSPNPIRMLLLAPCFHVERHERQIMLNCSLCFWPHTPQNYSSMRKVFIFLRVLSLVK